jgi:hypothetical protein
VDEAAVMQHHGTVVFGAYPEIVRASRSKKVSTDLLRVATRLTDQANQMRMDDCLAQEVETTDADDCMHFFANCNRSKWTTDEHHAVLRRREAERVRVRPHMDRDEVDALHKPAVHIVTPVGIDRIEEARRQFRANRRAAREVC